MSYSAKFSEIYIPQNLTIQGGNPTHGTIDISGAKNSVLGLMAASVLTQEEFILRNVPFITDVLDMCEMLRLLGVDVDYQAEKKYLKIQAKEIKTNKLDRDLGIKFRASYYLWGALLSRFSITNEFDSLIVPLPGGCSLAKGGGRPHDYHESLLKANLGAIAENEDKNLVFKLSKIKELSDFPTVFTTSRPSHGATMHWLLSTVGTTADTVMYGASQEPEINDLVDLLNKMSEGIAIYKGQKETGLSKEHLKKETSLLHGVDHSVMPDRIEAATYSILSSITKGSVTLKGVDIQTMSPFLNRLRGILPDGVLTTENGKTLHITARNLNFKNMLPQKLIMSPFPGDETDLQQIWTPLLSYANGDSYIIDPIWPGRTMHLPELNRMGVSSDFKIEDQIVGKIVDGEMEVLEKRPTAFIRINGNPNVKYASSAVSGPDLRGTMALMIMAANLKSETTIDKPEYALRGYPNLIDNLKKLGLGVNYSK